MSWSIRVGALLVPLAAGFVAAKVFGVMIARPTDRVLFVGWMVLMMTVSVGASIAAQRLARRIAPLAALFQLSLVFPDQAPSRFRTALRAGSSRSLARRLETPESGSSSEQAAAELLIELLARLSRHDRLTRGHSERVRAYSVMLGEQIGLDHDDLDKLNWAALAHDLGKLDVPAAVLNKAGRPTDEEWTLLRGHPGAANAYIEPLRPWLGEWIDAATQHHERYDGAGYPQSLAGTDIALSARIVALCDAYDVMTAARSYKTPLPVGQARAELLRNAGTHFDPSLVRSFLQISLGRERWLVGGFGWLAHLPELVRTPMAAAVGSGSGFVGAAAVSIAAVTGAGMPTPDSLRAAPIELAVERPGADHSDGDDLGELVVGSPQSGDQAGLAAGSSVPEFGQDDQRAYTDAVEIAASPGALSSATGPTEPPATSGPGGAALQPSAGSSSSVASPTTSPPVATTRQATNAVPVTSATPVTTIAPAMVTTPVTTVPPSPTTAVATTSAPTTVPSPSAPWILGAAAYTGVVPNLLSTGLLDPGALPDFDGDNGPGLSVKRGNGLDVGDEADVRRWWTPLTSDARLRGIPTVEVWVATRDFDTSKSGRIAVGLYNCNPVVNQCKKLVVGSATFDQSTYGSGFGKLVVTLPAIDTTISADRGLMLKIAVTHESDDDVWLAFATTTYPAQLSFM